MKFMCNSKVSNFVIIFVLNQKLRTDYELQQTPEKSNIQSGNNNSK